MFEEHGTKMLDLVQHANLFAEVEKESDADDKTKESKDFQHNMFPNKILETGQEILVIVVKRTYDLDMQDNCIPSTEQHEVLAGDIFYGNDATRSTRFEHDFIPFKDGVDVIINGKAYAPQGFPTPSFDVAFRLGRYEKRLKIFGKRFARYIEPPPPPPPPKDLKEGEEPPPPPPPPFPEFTDPEPITTLPLRYEYAYGGKSKYYPPYPEEEEEEQPPEDPKERKAWEKQKEKEKKEAEKEKKKKLKKGEVVEEEPPPPPPPLTDEDVLKPDAKKKLDAIKSGEDKGWPPVPESPTMQKGKILTKDQQEEVKKEEEAEARKFNVDDYFFQKSKGKGEATAFLDISKLDEEKDKEEARIWHEKQKIQSEEVKQKTDTKEGVDWMKGGDSMPQQDKDKDDAEQKKRSRAEMIRDYLLKEDHVVDTDSEWEKPDQDVKPESTRFLKIGEDDSYEGFEWAAEYMRPIEKKKEELEEELEEGVFRIPYGRNDIGKGFALDNRVETIDGLELPNIEDPNDLLTPERLPVDQANWQDAVVPAGFGVVKCSWFPRAAYGGIPPYEMDTSKAMYEFCKTKIEMDKFTEEERAFFENPEFPVLKKRFFNCASIGMIFPSLQGDEEMTLINMTENGHLTFKLPGEVPFVTLDLGEGPMDVDCPLDTVYVMPDERRVVLVWRGHTFDFPGVDRMKECSKIEVLVNRMTPAQMAAARAKAAKKEGGTKVLTEKDLALLEREEAELEYKGMPREARDRDGTMVNFEAMREAEQMASEKAEKKYRRTADKEAGKGKKKKRKKKAESTKVEMDIADLPMRDGPEDDE